MTDPAPLDGEPPIDAGPPNDAGPSDAGPSDATGTSEEAAISGTAAAPIGTDAAGRPWPPFAHGSETEMARILDFYGVRWEYEPRTFPILWNLDGNVVESFSPDFYLPDLDLFLELTTLKQRLVRKKNRKLRRLRELYPDIRIKLFYARDFRAMMLKYGRLALADSLSGTLGQVVPDRGREPDLDTADLTAGTTHGMSGEAVTAIRPAPGSSASTASGTAAGAFTAGSAQLPTAPGGSAGGLAGRRNASRSRRRRAAAAARAAARQPADAAANRTTNHLQEDPGSR